jgi:hypothetical protein
MSAQSLRLCCSATLQCGGLFTLSFEGPPLFRMQSMQPSVMWKPRRPDLNHFYPRDSTLRPGLQQLRNTTAPPDEEELRWRELSRRYAPPQKENVAATFLLCASRRAGGHRKLVATEERETQRKGGPC